MPFGAHWFELLPLVLLALLFFGPKRLPEMGSAIGKTIKEFQKSMREVREPEPPTAAALPPAATTDAPHEQLPQPSAIATATPVAPSTATAAATTNAAVPIAATEAAPTVAAPIAPAPSSAATATAAGPTTVVPTTVATTEPKASETKASETSVS